MHVQQEAPVQQGFLAQLDRPDRLDLQISPLMINRDGLTDFHPRPVGSTGPTGPTGVPGATGSAGPIGPTDRFTLISDHKASADLEFTSSRQYRSIWRYRRNRSHRNDWTKWTFG